MLANYRVGSLSVAIIIAVSTASTDSIAKRRDQAGRFSHYTLTLTWSPTYCANLPRGRKDRQCQTSRRYAFVLHGLWPQYRRGWPQFCWVRKSWVPRQIIDSMLDIMPNPRLVIHEWRKHGTCSGLAPHAYFKLSRQLFERIKIPQRYVRPSQPIVTSPGEIEQDFLLANPNLDKNMISVTCSRRKRLREIRICFDRALKPRSCGKNQNQAKLCRSKRIIMPPVRGGAPKTPGLPDAKRGQGRSL